MDDLLCLDESLQNNLAFQDTEAVCTQSKISNLMDMELPEPLVAQRAVSIVSIDAYDPADSSASYVPIGLLDAVVNRENEGRFVRPDVYVRANGKEGTSEERVGMPDSNAQTPYSSTDAWNPDPQAAWRANTQLTRSKLSELDLDLSRQMQQRAKVMKNYRNTQFGCGISVITQVPVSLPIGAEQLVYNVKLDALQGFVTIARRDPKDVGFLVGYEHEDPEFLYEEISEREAVARGLKSVGPAFAALPESTGQQVPTRSVEGPQERQQLPPIGTNPGGENGEDVLQVDIGGEQSGDESDDESDAEPDESEDSLPKFDLLEAFKNAGIPLLSLEEDAPEYINNINIPANMVIQRGDSMEVRAQKNQQIQDWRAEVAERNEAYHSFMRNRESNHANDIMKLNNWIFNTLSGTGSVPETELMIYTIQMAPHLKAYVEGLTGIDGRPLYTFNQDNFNEYKEKWEETYASKYAAEEIYQMQKDELVNKITQIKMQYTTGENYTQSDEATLDQLQSKLEDLGPLAHFAQQRLKDQRKAVDSEKLGKAVKDATQTTPRRRTTLEVNPFFIPDNKYGLVNKHRQSCNRMFNEGRNADWQEEYKNFLEYQKKLDAKLESNRQTMNNLGVLLKELKAEQKKFVAEQDEITQKHKLDESWHDKHCKEGDIREKKEELEQLNKPGEDARWGEDEKLTLDECSDRVFLYVPEEVLDKISTDEDVIRRDARDILQKRKKQINEDLNKCKDVLQNNFSRQDRMNKLAKKIELNSVQIAKEQKRYDAAFNKVKTATRIRRTGSTDVERDKASRNAIKRKAQAMFGLDSKTKPSTMETYEAKSELQVDRAIERLKSSLEDYHRDKIKWNKASENLKAAKAAANTLKENSHEKAQEKADALFNSAKEKTKQLSKDEVDFLKSILFKLSAPYKYLEAVGEHVIKQSETLEQKRNTANQRVKDCHEREKRHENERPEKLIKAVTLWLKHYKPAQSKVEKLAAEGSIFTNEQAQVMGILLEIQELVPDMFEGTRPSEKRYQNLVAAKVREYFKEMKEIKEECKREEEKRQAATKALNDHNLKIVSSARRLYETLPSSSNQPLTTNDLESLPDEKKSKALEVFSLIIQSKFVKEKSTIYKEQKDSIGELKKIHEAYQTKKNTVIGRIRRNALFAAAHLDDDLLEEVTNAMFPKKESRPKSSKFRKWKISMDAARKLREDPEFVRKMFFPNSRFTPKASKPSSSEDAGGLPLKFDANAFLDDVRNEWIADIVEYAESGSTRARQYYKLICSVLKKISSQYPDIASYADNADCDNPSNGLLFKVDWRKMRTHKLRGPEQKRCVERLESYLTRWGSLPIERRAGSLPPRDWLQTALQMISPCADGSEPEIDELTGELMVVTEIDKDLNERHARPATEQQEKRRTPVSWVEIWRNNSWLCVPINDELNVFRADPNNNNKFSLHLTQEESLMQYAKQNSDTARAALTNGRKWQQTANTTYEDFKMSDFTMAFYSSVFDAESADFDAKSNNLLYDDIERQLDVRSRQLEATKRTLPTYSSRIPESGRLNMDVDSDVDVDDDETYVDGRDMQAEADISRSRLHIETEREKTQWRLDVDRGYGGMTMARGKQDDYLKIKQALRDKSDMEERTKFMRVLKSAEKPSEPSVDGLNKQSRIQYAQTNEESWPDIYEKIVQAFNYFIKRYYPWLQEMQNDVNSYYNETLFEWMADLKRNKFPYVEVILPNVPLSIVFPDTMDTTYIFLGPGPRGNEQAQWSVNAGRSNYKYAATMSDQRPANFRFFRTSQPLPIVKPYKKGDVLKAAIERAKNLKMAEEERGAMKRKAESSKTVQRRGGVDIAFAREEFDAESSRLLFYEFKRRRLQDVASLGTQMGGSSNFIIDPPVALTWQEKGKAPQVFEGFVKDIKPEQMIGAIGALAQLKPNQFATVLYKVGEEQVGTIVRTNIRVEEQFPSNYELDYQIIKDPDEEVPRDFKKWVDEKVWSKAFMEEGGEPSADEAEDEEYEGEEYEDEEYDSEESDGVDPDGVDPEGVDPEGVDPVGLVQRSTFSSLMTEVDSLLQDEPDEFCTPMCDFEHEENAMIDVALNLAALHQTKPKQAKHSYSVYMQDLGCLKSPVISGRPIRPRVLVGVEG